MAYDYEYKTPLQVDYGWGITFNTTGKIPIESKRIFLTKEMAQKYIDNVNDSAIPGIIISVINDPIEDNNGAYFIKKIADGSTTGEMEKIGVGDFKVENNTLILN